MRNDEVSRREHSPRAIAVTPVLIDRIKRLTTLEAGAGRGCESIELSASARNRVVGTR
jgi:hypothetical protein